jgi:hypothetical protein
MSRSNSATRATTIFAAVVLAFASADTWAQTWTSASPGDLLTGSNWSGGTAPNAIDASANIATNPTNAGNFTLNGSMTVGAFNYSNSQSRGIIGSGTLTLQKSSGNGEFNIENGSMLVDVPMAISITARFQIDSAASVDGVISGAGALQKGGGCCAVCAARFSKRFGIRLLNL